MAHVFNMLYDGFNLEEVTVDDLIRIVFSSVLDKRINELEDEEKNTSPVEHGWEM